MKEATVTIPLKEFDKMRDKINNLTSHLKEISSKGMLIDDIYEHISHDDITDDDLEKHYVNLADLFEFSHSGKSKLGITSTDLGQMMTINKNGKHIYSTVPHLELKLINLHFDKYGNCIQCQKLLDTNRTAQDNVCLQCERRKQTTV